MITITRSEWVFFLVVCVCVCVCVCVRERDRDRDRETERQRDRERERQSIFLNFSYLFKEENCRTKDYLISNIKPSLEFTE